MSEQQYINDQEELDAVIKCLTARHQPREILLFGSRTKGNNKPDSDIDLCLIYDQLPKRKLEILQELYKILFGMNENLAVDLLVFQTDAYRERAKKINTIEHVIQRDGKVIYGH